MKKLVFLAVLAGLLAAAGCVKKPDILPAVDGSGNSLRVLAKRYVDHKSGEINPPEIREDFQIIEGLIQTASWEDIDGLAVFFESTFRDVEEKSRIVAFLFLSILDKELSDKERKPLFKRHPRLGEVYQEWRHQQDNRLARVHYILGALKPRIEALNKELEVKKIKDSPFLSFILDVKETDNDEAILARYNQGRK